MDIFDKYFVKRQVNKKGFIIQKYFNSLCCPKLPFNVSMWSYLFCFDVYLIQAELGGPIADQCTQMNFIKILSMNNFENKFTFSLKFVNNLCNHRTSKYITLQNAAQAAQFGPEWLKFMFFCYANYSLNIEISTIKQQFSKIRNLTSTSKSQIQRSLVTHQSHGVKSFAFCYPFIQKILQNSSSMILSIFRYFA